MPARPVPREWFGKVTGKCLLRLASGGALLAGLFEDGWLGDSWLYAKKAPVAIAARAIKPR